MIVGLTSRITVVGEVEVLHHAVAVVLDDDVVVGQISSSSARPRASRRLSVTLRLLLFQLMKQGEFIERGADAAAGVADAGLFRS